MLHSSVLQLNHSQILTFPDNSYSLAPAPGIDKINIPISFLIRTHIISSGYGNINAGALLQIQYSGKAISTNIRSLGLDSAPSNNFAAFSSPFVDALDIMEQTATQVNQPIQLSAFNFGDGNFTFGNAANTLTVGITYLIFNVNTNEFE